MALEKEFQVNNTGYTAKYIKIQNMSISNNDDIIEIAIQCLLYKDEASRKDGKEAVITLNVNVEEESFKESILDLLYKKIATLPEFKGAKNV